MRRYAPCALAAGMVLVAACGASGPSGDTTTALSAPISSTTPFTSPQGSTTTPSTSTATHPPAETMPALLVAGPEGVFLVEPGADPVRLVDGRAAIAVDDGLGGLLYQIDAGRDWNQTGSPRTTIVWWVPAGSERPLDLLVPTADQSLTLEDAAAVDGNLTVLYRRSEGAVSFEMVDSLRSYDRATASVTELTRGSAWEAGFDIGSVGGGLIAGTSYGQIDASCFFLDLDGAPFPTPADPSVPGCEEPNCPRHCTLSPDGRRLAHLETRFDESTNTTLAYEVVVDDMETGDELARIEIPHPDWGVSGLGIFGDWVLVNHTAGDEQARAWILSTGGTEVPEWEIPAAGVARFVTAPVTVRPAPLVLGNDGLGIVALGQPMASAMPLLEARFGAATSERAYEGDQGCEGSGYEGPSCCFAATGYGCDEVFRSLWWEEPGLSVVFSDRSYRDDGIPHLTLWAVHHAGVPTETGISIGDTAGDLRAAYGEQLVGTSTVCGDETAAYRTSGEHPMVFELSGPPDDPAASITSIWAGNPGSC